MHWPAPSKSNRDALKGKTLFTASCGVISSSPARPRRQVEGDIGRASRQEFPAGAEV
jgi:hypothetical protein